MPYEKQPEINQDDAVSARLALARAAKTAKLGDKSPSAQGREKTKRALDWIYRFGWTSPSVLDELSGSRASGHGTKLVARGLLRRTRTTSGGGLHGVPNYMLTLTDLGLQEAEREATRLLPYEYLNPYKINQLVLRHDLLAQMGTLRLHRSKNISCFETPAELALMSRAKVKQFDCVWVYPDGKRVGLEVELTAKWSRKLDEFVMAVYLALSNKIVDRVLIITDAPRVFESYTQAFAAGATMNLWNKNDLGRFVVVDKLILPAWVCEKVTCEFVGS